MSFIKNFIISSGTVIVDIAVILLEVLVIVASLVSMVKSGFIVGFATFLICSISTIISAYFVYLLIDIRENIAKIANAKATEVTTPQNQQ